MPDAKRSIKNAGFTLIEIMIVIAIIAAVLALGAPRMFSTSSSMRSAIRKMGVLTREIRNVSRLTNTTGRLVIQMDDEKGHAYWVETAPGTALMMSEEQQKDFDSMTELQKEESGHKEKFQVDPRLVPSPISLPRGLYFESVEYAKLKEPLTKGKAYIHFFPQGLSEEVAIHLTDKKTLNWTITVHPLTGRAEVLERKVALKDLRE